MSGKYSPTVNEAYRKDQNWHSNYANGEIYDPEGFDSYGYNQEGYDRAGNSEEDYYASSDDEQWGSSEYDLVHEDWCFDGIKPILGNQNDRRKF